MASRYDDWMRQALRDLDHDRRSLQSGDYEWACFAAQQGAEKGVKATFLKIGQETWGHSVTSLLQQLPAPWMPEEALVNAARELDRHYIPPRYPNSYPEGAPYEYYTEQDAEHAIANSGKILEFCASVLAGSGTGEDMPDDGRAGDGETSP